jgi:hypothetical protein
VRSRAGVLSPVLALGILLACGNGNADRVAPITGEQRARILTAVEELRAALNRGPCESVLDLAVERARTGEQSRDWAAKCRHVRETWGDWRSFDANYWYRSGSSAIAVEGIAGFVKGNCVVQVVWDLQSASPLMVFFFLRSNEDRVDFPKVPSPYVDPPTPQVRKNMQSVG